MAPPYAHGPASLSGSHAFKYHQKWSTEESSNELRCAVNIRFLDSWNGWKLEPDQVFNALIKQGTTATDHSRL